ncbi:MAG: CBS domain-containing protein [Pirellulales bacterium]
MLSKNFRRFLRQESASSSAELAVMLGVLALTVIGSVWLLGEATRDSYQQLSGKLSSSTTASGVANSAAGWQSPDAAAVVKTPSGGIPIWHVGLAAAVSVITPLFWGASIIARRRRRPADEPVLKEDTEGDGHDALFLKRQQMLRQLAAAEGRLNEDQLLVRHVLTGNPIGVLPTTPAAEIRRSMAERGCRHLLVCRDGQLLGLISDRDLGNRDGKTAADLMTKNPISVTSETPLFRAITLMIKRHISCLPVVDDGMLRGIVTTTDILIALQCSVRILTRDLASPALPQPLES